MGTEWTTIPCSPATLKRLRAQKQGGQTYDELLQEMLLERTASRDSPADIEGVSEQSTR